MKIAACVILYHPKEKDLQNLSTYLSKVDKLYIYDNTENVSTGTDLKNDPKIVYFSDYENKGIAARLNQACEQAILDGYDLLLTMDQDSSFLEKKYSARNRITASAHCCRSFVPTGISSTANCADWLYFLLPSYK